MALMNDGLLNNYFSMLAALVVSRFEFSALCKQSLKSSYLCIEIYGALLHIIERLLQFVNFGLLLMLHSFIVSPEFAAIFVCCFVLRLPLLELAIIVIWTRWVSFGLRPLLKLSDLLMKVLDHWLKLFTIFIFLLKFVIQAHDFVIFGVTAILVFVDLLLHLCYLGQFLLIPVLVETRLWELWL